MNHESEHADVEGLLMADDSQVQNQIGRRDEMELEFMSNQSLGKRSMEPHDSN